MLSIKAAMIECPSEETLKWWVQHVEAGSKRHGRMCSTGLEITWSDDRVRAGQVEVKRLVMGNRPTRPGMEKRTLKR